MEQFLQQDSVSTIIYVGLAILMIYLVLKILKSIVKIVLFALLLIAAFFVWQQQSEDGIASTPFDSAFEGVNSVKDIKKNCRKKENWWCDCVSDIVHKDIKKRLSYKEQQELEGKPVLVLNQIRKSIGANTSEILNCTANAKGGDLGYKFKDWLNKAKEDAVDAVDAVDELRTKD